MTTSFVIARTVRMDGGGPTRVEWNINESDEDNGTFSQRGPVENNITYYRGTITAPTVDECYVKINGLLADEGLRLARVYRPMIGWEYRAVPLNVDTGRLLSRLVREGDAVLSRSDYRVELLPVENLTA